MAEILVPPGDARILGGVVRPELLAHLGEHITNTALPDYDAQDGMYPLGAFLYDEGVLREGVNKRVPSIILAQLFSLIQHPLAGLYDVEEAIISGADGKHLGWHPDSPGTLRFLTNLNPDEEAKLDIATKWDPAGQEPGEIKESHQPEESRTLILPPYHTYCINALATNTDVLRPHQTHKDENRLVLRHRLYYQPEWKDLADPEEGGVVARLVLPDGLTPLESPTAQ